MSHSLNRLFVLMAIVVANAMLATPSPADPLPGRDLLKFQQKVMNATTITNTSGQVVGTYYGHDELSTAYGFGNAANPATDYQGRFMADDFSDNYSSPVVHVKWWGSYLDNNIQGVPAQPPVQKFLIAFEADHPGNPSFPDPTDLNVLQWDIVTVGALAPGSGTFTETLLRGPDPVLGEALYEYNAELHFGKEFQEQAGKVYWLKIAALVDLPPNTPLPPPPGTTKWGWHNRDYTLQDTLASAVPIPGENAQGPVAGQTVWHFQDDAVQGDLRFLPNNPTGSQIFQTNMTPKNYVGPSPNGLGDVDGPSSNIPGVIGINDLSKDLAFELYTTQNIPEPATCLLLVCGSLGLMQIRRRPRG